MPDEEIGDQPLSHLPNPIPKPSPTADPQTIRAAPLGREGPVLVRSTSEFTGPLPPPNILGDYERVHPGLANKIVEMALRRHDHEREMDRQMIELAKTAQSDSAKEISRGQLFALIVALACIIGSVIMALF